MKLQEYYYPTIKWKPNLKDKEYTETDYAEIEIIPDENEEYLLENLDRYTEVWADELTKKLLNDKNTDYYEHIIAYVHFEEGTYNFDRMIIEVITAYSADEIKVLDKMSFKEKVKIIMEARNSLEKWRNKDKVIIGS